MTQILSHTPLYVWAILGFLVYRGVLASRTREVTLRKLCIIPLVMLALSISGVIGSFGLAGMAPYAWAAGMLAGTALAWKLANPRAITAFPERGTVQRAGSWMPLVLMLAIFCMKYAVAVTLAVAPARAHAAGFILSACCLYGLFSGIFTGSLLHTLQVYRHSMGQPLHAAAAR